jgi:hypothetical protein
MMVRKAHVLSSTVFAFLVGWSVAATAQSAPTAAFPVETTPEEPAPPPTTPANASATGETSAPATTADGASAPSDATQPVVAPPQTPWTVAFAKAKNDFILGKFTEAEMALKQLTTSTSDPVERARAEELLTVTQTWNRRGASLVEQRELEGSDLLARRTDRRTADEIGVLYTSATAYGLGGGIWLSFLNDANSPEGWVLPAMLLAGASAGAVALLDSGKGLRYGTAQAISSGMWLGLWQGLAWGTYYQAASNRDEELEEGQYGALLFGASTIGAVTGGLVGTYSATTPGRAAFVGTASLWPAVILGFGVTALMDGSDVRDDRALLSASLGLTAGSVVGMLVAGDVAPTTARVRFLDLGAVAGSLALGGLILAADGDEETVAGGVSVGAAAGLGLAWALTSGMPKDKGAEKRQTATTVVPMIQPQRGGMTLGVAAAF